MEMVTATSYWGMGEIKALTCASHKLNVVDLRINTLHMQCPCSTLLIALNEKYLDVIAECILEKKENATFDCNDQIAEGERKNDMTFNPLQTTDLL